MFQNVFSEEKESKVGKQYTFSYNRYFIKGKGTGYLVYTLLKNKYQVILSGNPQLPRKLKTPGVWDQQCSYSESLSQNQKCLSFRGTAILATDPFLSYMTCYFARISFFWKLPWRTWPGRNDWNLSVLRPKSSLYFYTINTQSSVIYSKILEN